MKLSYKVKKLGRNNFSKTAYKLGRLIRRASGLVLKTKGAKWHGERYLNLPLLETFMKLKLKRVQGMWGNYIFTMTKIPSWWQFVGKPSEVEFYTQTGITWYKLPEYIQIKGKLNHKLHGFFKGWEARKKTLG